MTMCFQTEDYCFSIAYGLSVAILKMVLQLNFKLNQRIKPLGAKGLICTSES